MGGATGKKQEARDKVQGTSTKGGREGVGSWEIKVGTLKCRFIRNFGRKCVVVYSDYPGLEFHVFALDWIKTSYK